MAKVGLVSTRFYYIASDHILWKMFCAQHWEELKQVPPKSFYIDRFTSYVQHKQEAKIFKILMLFKTTSPYYFILFLCSFITYLMGLKLDAYINWPWYLVFIPVWLLDILLLTVVGTLLYFWISSHNTPELKVGFQRVFPMLSSAPTKLVLVTVLCSFVTFSVLVSCKLDNLIFSSWWIIFLPFFVICLIVTLNPVWTIRKGWNWASFWSILLAVSYDIALLVIVAKLENQVQGDWCLLFLPWWISDIFALVRAVSLCIELHTTKINWIVTMTYGGYMSCSMTFRSLLCVNLGAVCGDPTAYSYNLIFTSLQTFILLFGVPLILFFRYRVQKIS